MSKSVTFNEDARLGLLRGVNLISNAIKVTLGPRGRNVIYGFAYGYPVCTKDGVTVARQVESKDQLEQMGVQLVRQVAVKTADDTGDGTTTASLLTQAIYTEGLKSINTGANPVLVKRGIDKAVDKVVQFIEDNSIKIRDENDILNVATVSANNDQDIGLIVAEAINKVGYEGVITIEDNYNDAETTITTVEGMQLNEGYLSPFFVTDKDKLICRYDNPYLLLCDGEIQNPVILQKIFEEVMGGKEVRPLCIICHGLSPIALQVLVSNRVKSGLPIVVCKASQFNVYRTELLRDVAALTGARVVGSASGLFFDNLTKEDLGQCEVFVAGKGNTIITGGKGKKEDLNSRIRQIETELDAATSDYEKEKLQERYAKLTSGVAVIKVGAKTEVEQKEKKMRVEDALCATKTAIDGGIVAGGGTALLRASRKALNDDTSELSDEDKIGQNIVKKALVAPITTIAQNSGIPEGDIIAEINRNDNLRYGYDFLNNKYGDLVDMGIIDPTKVVTMALRNAASVAGMMLTTECVINEDEELEVTKMPRPRSE